MFFLRCNLYITDVNKVCNLANSPFWLEILETWSEWNYTHYHVIKEEILHMPLWYNSLLKISKKVIIYKKWYDKNILYVADLIVENRWMNVHEVSKKYGFKANFLELRSLISCMPAHWKHILFVESNTEFKGYKIDNFDYSCKSVYKEMLKTKIVIPEQYVHFWMDNLHTEIDEWDWYGSFTECKLWTISTKLRSFYFQLRVNDIMTNSKLVKMTIKTDPACEWCKAQDQTIIHLFWECPCVRPIWDKLGEWLSKKLQCDLVIEKELIFLHDIEAGNLTIIINLIILVVTRYIYVCHCIDKQPQFRQALNKIADIELLERCIAKKNNTLFKHNRKWRQLIE